MRFDCVLLLPPNIMNKRIDVVVANYRKLKFACLRNKQRGTKGRAPTTAAIFMSKQKRQTEWTESNLRFTYYAFRNHATTIHVLLAQAIGCVNGECLRKRQAKTMFDINIFSWRVCRLYLPNHVLFLQRVREVNMDLYFMCGALKITEISVLLWHKPESAKWICNSKVNIMHVLQTVSLPWMFASATAGWAFAHAFAQQLVVIISFGGCDSQCKTMIPDIALFIQ